MSNSENELLVWLAWLHGAFVFVPPLILAAKLEWEDWVESHAKGIRGWGWHLPQPAH